MECISIKNLLSDLNDTATKIRENRDFRRKIKKQLKENGYDWFDYDPSQKDCEQVIRVFATAINDGMKKKVDLITSKTDDLERLLKIDEKKSLRDYFEADKLTDPVLYASSPLEMANCLKKSAAQWLVAKIIQHQFDITWRTMTGEPDDYTFYEFCDSENTKKFFKYIPRQAHVKATVYKECRKKNVDTLRAITKDELCPKVYIRTTTGWKTWQADNPKKFEKNANKLEWMDESIQNFIVENADEQKDDDSLIDSLTKPTLYWAVLHDSDFKSGEKLKLNKIGETQVYVGKAKNGIEGRWCEDGDNHCEMMSECLRNVCNMTTYDPSRLDGIALVDARLTLAKVRKEKTALFVIKTFGDEVEKAEIAEREAEMECDEAEEEYEIANEEYEIANEEFNKAKKKLKSRELTNIEKAKNDALSAKNKAFQAFQTCKEECDEASEATNNLKKRSQKEVEKEAINNLEEAEKQHRKGKKIQNKHHNVIPSNICPAWTPKNMAFGMNKY